MGCVILRRRERVKMKILLTNDDGIQAPGIRALRKALKEEFQLAVVAPHDEKSATSHSISLGKYLRVREFVEDGIPHYAVHGTPVDCVKFALSELEDFEPDLVLSGINQGANTGVSVYYSGTVSAAREALINRVPAMAVSLCSRDSVDFSAAVQMTLLLIRGFFTDAFPPDVLISVNVPALPVEQLRGIKVTKQAASRFVEEFIYETSESGEKLYRLAGEIEVDDTDGTSDEEAVLEQCIALTPLRIDLTDYEALAPLKKWLATVPEMERQKVSRGTVV